MVAAPSIDKENEKNTRRATAAPPSLMNPIRQISVSLLQFFEGVISILSFAERVNTTTLCIELHRRVLYIYTLIAINSVAARLDFLHSALSLSLGFFVCSRL